MTFRHVGREYNGLADWLARVARVKEETLDLLDTLRGRGPFSPPPCKPEQWVRGEGGR